MMVKKASARETDAWNESVKNRDTSARWNRSSITDREAVHRQYAKNQQEKKRKEILKRRDNTELDSWHNETNTVSGQMRRDRRATPQLNYRENRRQAATNESWQNRDASAYRSTVGDNSTHRKLRAQRMANNATRESAKNRDTSAKYTRDDERHRETVHRVWQAYQKGKSKY
jgi:hypothetical protein